MTLGEKQRRFTECIGRLIEFAYHEGFELTFGDAYRSPEQAAANAAAGTGISNSVHTIRLAVDFNLFVNGQYRPDPEPYAPLGEFWLTLDPLARWGGSWKKKDANHFSFEHNGVQ